MKHTMVIIIMKQKDMTNVKVDKSDLLNHYRGQKGRSSDDGS